MSAVIRALAALLVAMLLGGAVAGCTSRGGDSGPGSETSSASGSGAAPGSSSAAPKPSPMLTSTPRPGSGNSASSSEVSRAGNRDVPPRVRGTLAHIDAGDWPDAADAPGTHGGDPFGNREGRLPATSGTGKPVRYREWDVNPKKPGRGRDAERIVTGDDGSAWYTLDHYDHFTRIR